MSASFQLSEIKSMIGDVAKDDPSFISMKNFRFDIQSQLIEALNFALRAFRVYRRGVENYDAIALKRGDIIFGFEKDEHIKDITIIFQVCILYITHFDNLKKRLLPAEIDEIRSVVDFLLTLTDTSDLTDDVIEQLRDQSGVIIGALGL